MRAILLAAGIGRRFKGAWPKPLKRLYGQQTVLGYTVQMLRFLGLDITIVIGHRAAEYLPLFGNFATFVYNPDYAHYEWMTSARQAISLLPEGGHYLLGCADTLIKESTARLLIDRLDSVLLTPCTPEEGYYRVRCGSYHPGWPHRMLETEPEPNSPGEWPSLTWGGWGHVGHHARRTLFGLDPAVVQGELPAHMFVGCTPIIGPSYNINTLEDLEVARKAFSGSTISDKGES